MYLPRAGTCRECIYRGQEHLGNVLTAGRNMSGMYLPREGTCRECTYRGQGHVEMYLPRAGTCREYTYRGQEHVGNILTAGRNM